MISAFSKQDREINLTFCSSNFPNPEIWGNKNLRINNKRGGGGEDAFNRMCLMASIFSRIDCVSKQLKILMLRSEQ